MCSQASAVIVRPSEHLTPNFVAYPPKSGSTTVSFRFVVERERSGREFRHSLGSYLDRLLRGKCGRILLPLSEFRLRHVAVAKLISLRVLARLPTQDLTEFVGRENLVTGQLVNDLCYLIDRNDLERVIEVHDTLTLGARRLRQERPPHGFHKRVR